MHCFLKDADARPDTYNSETLKNLVSELKDLAFTAEDVHDKYAIEVAPKRKGGNLKRKLKRYACILNECLTLHQVAKETESIKTRMTNLTKKLESIPKGESSSNSTYENDHLLRQTYGHQVEEHFVGMEKDIEILVSLVLDGNKSNRVISICGMGGLGKTTVATKIYQRGDVQKHFEARAWVCISQRFEFKSVLQQILKQLLPSTKERMETMDQNELVKELHNVQMQKRCLVVIDDMWETDHWNILKVAFPLTCKVLLTTRNENIAAQEIHVHKLNYLTEDQGWELLQKIALPINYIQELKIDLKQLEDIGREIVRRCGNLPLAISVIGGSLRQKNSLREWKKVITNFDLKHGEGVGGDKRVKQVLDLSYNALPYYLKPCFLYLGCFREDEEIDAEELYLLWMAEGMISSQDKGRKETLRDVAERYLNELAFRCMIQMQNCDDSNPDKKSRSCRLHDLMHDLCLSKGEDEGFLKVMDFRQGKIDVPSVGTPRRLTIHFDEIVHENFNNRAKFESLRSLLFRNTFRFWLREGTRSSLSNFDKLKFLRVLKLESCDFENGKLPSEIKKLIHLRYLSLFDSYVVELPSSICDLPCLKTLDLCVSCEIRLPNNIYKMEKLRHLFVRVGGVTIGENGDKLRLDGLKALETFYGFDSKYFCSKDLPKLVNLRSYDATVYDNESLSLIVDCMKNNPTQFWETTLYIDFNDFILEKDSLVLRDLFLCPSLHELTICGRIGCKLPSYQQDMCTKLLELALDNSGIKEDALELLGKFPVLEKLTLCGNVFANREVIWHATGFLQLKYLGLLEMQHLEKWRVDEGALPNLSYLRIYKCSDLKMIPDWLGFITTLQTLEISLMPENFCDRLKVEGQDYDKICHIPSIKIW